MITTILVPTDGSVHAVKAVTFAADIASKYDARLVLLHSLFARVSSGELLNLIDAGQLSDPVLEDLKHMSSIQHRIEATAPLVMRGIPPSTELLQRIGEDMLRSGEALAREHGADKIDRLLTNGDPIHCILKAVDDEKADVIVMGSRGLGDLEGLLVGSVSHKVSHLAACTVITVK